MTDLWWCETHNERGKDDSCWQVTDWPPDCQMVRLTAHHQDGRLIGLLAWDRCDDCEGTGRRLCSHDHHIPGDTTNGCVMYRPCPSCRDGWVPRAIGVIYPLKGVVIPLEDTDD